MQRNHSVCWRTLDPSSCPSTLRLSSLDYDGLHRRPLDPSPTLSGTLEAPSKKNLRCKRLYSMTMLVVYVRHVWMFVP